MAKGISVCGSNVVIRAGFALGVVLMSGCGGQTDDTGDFQGVVRQPSQAPIARVAIGTSAQTIGAGQCSSVVKLNRRNFAGQLETTPAYMEIQLYGPGFSFFRDAACTQSTSFIPLNVGTHTNDLWFRNSISGSQPLTVGAVAHDGISQLQNITGTAPAVGVHIGTTAQTVDSDQCSSVVKLNRRNGAGQPATTPSYMEIQLSGPGFSFYRDAACSQATSIIGLGAGTHTNDVWFRNSIAGAQPLTIGAAGHNGASQVQTIRPTPSGGTGLGPGVPHNLAEMPPEYRPAPPVAPTITRTVNATTAAMLSAEGGTAGTRVVVDRDLGAAAITIRVSDIELEIRPGGRIMGIAINSGMSRIAVHGGGRVQELNMLPSTTSSDVRIAGITFISPRYGQFGGDSMKLRGRRIAVTNCITHAGLYSVWADNDGTDILIANNDFFSEGEQATIRLVGWDRSAVLNNRLENGIKHNYRIHHLSQYYYAANNVLIGSGFMLADSNVAEDVLRNGIFRNNALHWLRNGRSDIRPAQVETLVLTGNQLYADSWSCFYCGTIPATWTVDNPPGQPWQCPMRRVAGAPAGLTCTQ